ncbi:titin [Musca domestica]|uniref:Titin n=1 Tax=Musca domestica TaxID=7370 RepID=A0A1I8NHQ9_MUSDO|nr:titin [Musca domestica]
MDTAGGAVAAVSSIVAAANQTTSSPVPASSSPSANVIIHGNQSHGNVGAGVGGHHDHHHHHHSSLVHSNIISSASNSSSSSSNSSSGSLIIGHGSAGSGGNIAGGGSSNSSTSSNSSGYGSTSATPTNSYESHGTPTTPVAIAEPIIPVATVATVTPFYSEAINHQANNTQNYSAQHQQQQQPQYQLNSASQHLGQPAVPQHSQTNFSNHQQHQSLQQHQLQPQLQHSQRSQSYSYPTVYDYNQQYQQDSSLLTQQQQIHPGTAATAYGLGASSTSSSGNFDPTLQSNSLTPYQQSMGHSYKSVGPTAIPYERQRSSSGHLGSYQNDTTANKHSQPFGSTSASAASNASTSSGSNNLSASKSRSSTSLLGSMSSSSSSSGNPTSSVATTKPQAAATPFYAQPLAQAQTASASSYYAELQKHKMPLDYHHDQFGNFPNASAAAYHQQQKYYAAAKSQLKETGSYGSTPAKSLYHNANSFYGGSMAQHGASSMLAPNAGYIYPSTAYPTALGYESSSLDAVYRKSSATAPTLNSSTWHWGMDYAAGGNSRTTAAVAGGTAPPPTAAGHLPTATVAPTHASYLAPANTSHRDPYYMTADKYAMKYDKYPAAAPPPPYQQNAYVSSPATRHHHHLWPGGGHNPTAAGPPPPHSHVPHAGMHGSVNPYYSTNPAAAARQPCCPQPPYQTQNCYYPPTAAVPPPPPTGRITHGQPMGNLSQLTAAYPNQQSHMNQPASKYPASGLDYPPLSVNKLKTPNDLYLGTHHYDAATANPSTHTHLSHHRHPTGYQYGAAVPPVPGNQQLYTSNPQPHHPAHGQQPAVPLIAHDPHGSGYTNDLTTSYDSYLHEPISNSNSAAMGLGGAAAEMAATNYAVSTAKRALLDYRKPVTQTPPGDYYRPEQTGHRENAHPNYGGASHHHSTGDLLLNSSETTTSFNEYDSTAAYGHEAAADNQSKPASDDSTKNLSLRDFIANWNDDEDDYATGNEELMAFDQQQGSGVINEMLQNVNVESSHDDTTNLLQEKPLKAAEVPQSSVSTLPEDMYAQQYANLPDIIVDIEKSSNVNTFGPIADVQVAPNVSDMEKSTLNNLTTATGAQVAPNESANPTALSLDNFDVEKELDQLQQLQRKTGEDSVIVKPSQHNNVVVPGETPKSDITPPEENPQLTFEDLNLENAKTNNVPPASSATRPSATSVSNDAEGYDSGCSRHSNESSLFEKEYETFINKISTSCENLSKADKDIEQKVQDFSKFYKRKRKMRDENSKKPTEDLAMQDNKKSRNEAPNSPKESNFPQVYTKKSRNRTSSNASNKMAPKRRRKPSSFYYKAMQNIRRYPQHRCQMVRDYMADLKEKHLPLIKRQSIKNYSMQASPEAGDEELRPLPLKTLVLGVINSEDFRERFVISTMEMEEEEMEEDCTASEEKHICPDPSCETCEVIRSLMESQEVDAAAAAAIGDVNNFQTDVVKLSDEEIKNLASTEEIIVAKEVEDLSEGKVVLIPELPGEVSDVTKPEEETMIAEEQLAAQILEQELAQKDFRENLSSSTGGVIRKADLTTVTLTESCSNVIQSTKPDVETFNPSFQAIDSISAQPKIPNSEEDKPTLTNEITREIPQQEDLIPINSASEHPAPKDMFPEQRNPVIKIVNSYPNKEESPAQLMVQPANSEPREEPDQPSPKPIDSPRATSVIRKIETKPSDHDFEVKKKCYDRPDLDAASPQALQTTVIRKAKGKSQQSEENSNSPKPQTSSDEKSQKVKEKSAKNPPIILRIKAQTTTVIRKHVTANPEGSEPKESASSYINKTFTVSKVSPNKSDSEESSDSESDTSNSSSSSSENSDEERDESHSSSASDSDTDAEPENETLKTLRKVVEKCEKLSKIHETQKMKTETGDIYKTKGMLKEFNPTPADLNEDSKFSEESDVREVVASSPKLENPEIPQDKFISSTLATPKSPTPARSSRASEERELQMRSNEDEDQLSRSSVLATSLVPETDLVHAKCEDNLVENEEAPLDLSRQLSPLQTPVEDCHHSPNYNARESKEPLDFQAHVSSEESGLENIKPQSREQIIEPASTLNNIEEKRDAACKSPVVISVNESYLGSPQGNDENSAVLSPSGSKSQAGLNFDDPLTKNSDPSVVPLDIPCDESATENQVQQFQNEGVFIDETIAKHPDLSILPLDITVDGSITKNQDQTPQSSLVPVSTTNSSSMDNPESADSSCNPEKQEIIELSEDSSSSEESDGEEDLNVRNNQGSRDKFSRTASEVVNSENIVDITADSTSDEDLESEDDVISKPITPVKLRDLSDNESRPSSVDDANEPLFGNEDESQFNLVAKTPEIPVEALDESLKISLGLLLKEVENCDSLKETIPGSIDAKENQKTQGAEMDLQTGNDNESQTPTSCENLGSISKISIPLNPLEHHNLELQSSDKTLAHIMEPCSKSGSEVSLVHSNLEDAAHSPTADSSVLKGSVIADLGDLFSKDIRPNVQEVKCSTGNQNCEKGSTLAEKSREYSLLGEILEPDTKKTSVFAHECQEETSTGNRDQSEISTITDQIRENFLFGEALKPTSNKTSEFQNEDFTASCDKHPKNSLETNEIQKNTPERIESPIPELEPREEQQQTPGTIRSPTPEIENHVDLSNDSSTSSESTDSINQLPSIPQSENCVEIDREQQKTSERIASPTTELEVTEEQQKTPKSIASPTSEMEAIEEQQQTPESIRNPTSEMESHVDLSMDSMASSESPESINQLPSIPQLENCVAIDREQQETSERIWSPILELKTTEDQQKTPERIDSPTSEMERHVELSNDLTTSSESMDSINKLSSIQQPENCIEIGKEPQETSERIRSPLPELEMAQEQQKTPESLASPTSELERHVELSNDSTTSSESMDPINEISSISQPMDSIKTNDKVPEGTENLIPDLEIREEQQKSLKAIRSPTPVPQSQADLSDDSTTSSESSDASRSDDELETMDLHKRVDPTGNDLDRQSFQGLLENRETDAVSPVTPKRESNVEDDTVSDHDNEKLDSYSNLIPNSDDISSPRLEGSKISDNESDTSSQSSSDSSSSDASSPKRVLEENTVLDHESDSSSQSSDSSSDSESTLSPKGKTEEDAPDKLNIEPKSDALDLPKCCESSQEEDCVSVAKIGINGPKFSTQADEVVSEFSKSSSTSVDVDAEISHRKISNNVDDDLSVPDERENVPTCSNPSTPQSVTLLEKERTNSIIESTAEEILGQENLSADLKQEMLQDIAVEPQTKSEQISPEIDALKSLQEPLENENIEKPIYSVDFDGEVDTDKSTAEPGEVVNTETNSLNLDPEVETEISGIVESSDDPKIVLDIQFDTCTVSNSKEDSPNNDEFEPQDSQKEVFSIQDASLSQSAFLDDSTSTTKIEVMETAASQIPAASFTKYESQERAINDSPCTAIDFVENCNDVFISSTSANCDEGKSLDIESNSSQESKEVLLTKESLSQETRQQETKDKFGKDNLPTQEEGSTGDSPKTTEEIYSPSQIQEDSEEIQTEKQPDEVVASSAGSSEFIEETTESELKVQPELPKIPNEATEKEVESNAELTEKLAEAIQTEDSTFEEFPQSSERPKDSEVQKEIIIAEEPRETEVSELAEEPSDSEVNINQEISESVEGHITSEEFFTNKDNLTELEETVSPKAIAKVTGGLEDPQLSPPKEKAADKDPMSLKEISNITHGVEDPQKSLHDEREVISSTDLEVPNTVSVSDHLPETEESKIEENIAKSSPNVTETILKKSPLPLRSRETSPEMNFWNTKGKYRALRNKRTNISKCNNESKRSSSRKKSSKANLSQSTTDESSEDQDFILESQEKVAIALEVTESLNSSVNQSEVIESQEISEKKKILVGISADQSKSLESEKFAESVDLPKEVPLTADQFEIDLDDIPLPPPRSEEIKRPEIDNPRQDVATKYHSIRKRDSSPIESAKTLSADISKSVNTPNDSSPAGAYTDAEISSNSPDETTENDEEIAMVLSPKETSRTLSEDISSSENTPNESITADESNNDKCFNSTTKAATESYGETVLTSHHRRTSSPKEPRKSLYDDLSSSVNTPIGANPADASKDAEGPISSTDAVVEIDGGEIAIRSGSQETSSQSEAPKSLYKHISNNVNTPSATCPADEPYDVSNSVNPANESSPAVETHGIKCSSIFGDANSHDGIDLVPNQDISGRENTPNERSPAAEISLEHSNISADIAADGDNEIARISSPNERPKTPSADISCNVNTPNEIATTDDDFLSCKFQTSFDDGSDFNGFEDPHEEELLRREVENLNEDSAANDGFQYAISHLAVNKSPSKSSEIDELEALEKELSQQCLAQERDESKTEVDLDLVDRQGNNETEPQRVSLTNVSISTNDIEHIKKMLESDEEPANEENENASDDDTPQKNASGLECKENISSTNLCVIPKLSDLCRAALNSSLNIKNLTIVQSNANANDEDLEVVVATEMQTMGLESSNATPQNLLVERELSVEEALAEMYRQAGVLLSDPEDNESDKASITHNNNTTTNTTTAVAPNQDLLLINLHEILNSSDNDVYVLQCDISDNSNNNNNPTTNQVSENNATPANSDENQEIILPTERFNTLQLIGIVNRDNEGSEIHIISSDSESEVIILSDCDTDVEFQPPQPPPKCFSPRPPHREYIPFITDYEDQSSDSMSDLSTIHHEEIVPDNLNKFLQEEFFKYLHEKYAQKKLSRYYHANRVLKKYKKTRLLNKYRS